MVTIDKNYTAMRILPTSSLSQITSNKEVQERAKTDISNRIQRNPSNGDVLLEFPIVNHSPSKKVEQLRSDELITLYRQLRYFGVETDLSFLTYSTRNHTTDEVVRELLANVGVCWHSEEVVISLGQVKINIDAGQPLIFSMYDSKELDDRIIQRSEDRKKITDWVQWKNSLLKKTPDSKSVADWSQWKTDLLKYRNFHVIGSQRHMSYATIIGYNDDTREIAFSTPNNIYEPVIWLTEEEIRAIADGNASY
jgi:hypothetical protein